MDALEKSFQIGFSSSSSSQFNEMVMDMQEVEEEEEECVIINLQTQQFSNLSFQIKGKQSVQLLFNQQQEEEEEQEDVKMLRERVGFLRNHEFSSSSELISILRTCGINLSPHTLKDNEEQLGSILPFIQSSVQDHFTSVHKIDESSLTIDPKNTTLEGKTYQEMARCSNSFDFTNDLWNLGIGFLFFISHFLS